MTREQIEAEFRAIVAEDGPWTAASFEIAPGLWTLDDSEWRTSRATFALRNACLMLDKPPERLRVLDLGCLEGSMSIPMAQRGCEVVGLEIRAPSLRKARFVSRVLDLPNTTWVQGDMLALETFGLGTFDLVLCFGTLYHVDAPDLYPFVRAIDRSCRGIAIFDTHVALTATETYQEPERPHPVRPFDRRASGRQQESRQGRTTLGIG